MRDARADPALALGWLVDWWVRPLVSLDERPADLWLLSDWRDRVREELARSMIPDDGVA